MGFFEKLKKGIELKQNSPSQSTIQKTHEKISHLKKQLKITPKNSNLYLDLYGCYVELSDTTKKIECLKKITKLKPNDSYPLQQLADIYSNELNDMVQAKSFQDMANKIKKSF
jgi:tetratricopeptide (TPR) repeat protein